MKTVDPAVVLERMLKGKTQKELASDLGIAQSYLSAILCCEREPGPKVLAALRLERIVSYREIRE